MLICARSYEYDLGRRYLLIVICASFAPIHKKLFSGRHEDTRQNNFPQGFYFKCVQMWRNIDRFSHVWVKFLYREVLFIQSLSKIRGCVIMRAVDCDMLCFQFILAAGGRWKAVLLKIHSHMEHMKNRHTMWHSGSIWHFQNSFLRSLYRYFMQIDTF